VSRSQRELLREYGIRPVKRRGQNFLVDGNLARWIAATACETGKEILELGAGAGALTGHLLAAGAQVTAVEVDRNLCALLQDQLGDRSGFRLVEADLQKLDWPDVLAAAGRRPLVVGNLPYVLTSTVLFALADHRRRLAGAVLMVQREVAERLTSGPGSREYGILSVLLGSQFAIEVVRQVPASVFWPRPDVSSAVVRLVPTEAWPDAEYQWFRRLIKALFGLRRKKVGTVLRSLFALDPGDLESVAAAAQICPNRRPEQLPVERLRALANVLAERGDR